MTEKPWAHINPGNGRAHRWYPHEAVEHLVGTLDGVSSSRDLPWHLMRPDDAAAQLPHLKAGLTDLHRFVAMIERIADGEKPTTCEVCQSHFYPSRRDAKFCSGRCRARSHRGHDGNDTPQRLSRAELCDVAPQVWAVETPCWERHLQAWVVEPPKG
jgi:hypothetical protein